MKASPQTARRLRRDQTDAERVLWFRLRDRRFNGWKFRRQFPIDRFVVDFFCADAHLIIELDGGQHAVRAAADLERTKILEAMGYLVIRFWNNDVIKNIDGVLEEIDTALGSHTSELHGPSETSEPPHPNPLPFGERERDASARSEPSRLISNTSPQRGEVERAQRARVRGFGPHGSSEPSKRHGSSETSEPPHPNPLPSGERERM
jgi:very-short-patch-repair endonuclease